MNNTEMNDAKAIGSRADKMSKEKTPTRIVTEMNEMTIVGL